MRKSAFAGRALRVIAASGIVLGAFVPATAAFAEGSCYTNCTPNNQPTDPGSRVAGKTAAKSSGTLPFTGSDVAGIAAIGAGAAVAGALMVRHSKRNRVTV